MKGRLLINIVTTIAEEAAALIAGLWLLPRVGVRIPPAIVFVLMALWLGWTIFTYRRGTLAMKRKPVGGLTTMTGFIGVVVRPLQPAGMIKVNGELWSALSETGNIEVGARVLVVGQKGLQLSVQRDSSGPAAIDK